MIILHLVKIDNLKYDNEKKLEIRSKNGKSTSIFERTNK